MKLRMRLSIIAFAAMMITMFNHSIAAADSDNASLLFVVAAKSASIKAISEKTGHFHLILHNVNPKTTYFSDRPQREAGRMDLTKLVKQWQPGKSFATDPPNASLQVDVDHKAMTYSVEIIHAKYNADTNNVVFEIMGLPGGRIIADQKKLKNVSLFVDRFCPSCDLR